MRTFFSIIGCVALATIACSDARADVVFDFFETGVSGNCNIVPGCGPITPVSPVSILRMTLSNPTETGSATFTGSMPPVVTDPNFRLAESYPTYPAPFTATIFPSDFGWSGGAFPSGYSISWDAENGQLLGVNIAYTAVDDRVSLGLTSGTIGSDGAFGPYCSNGTCDVTGYWTRIPEPSSVSFVLSALTILGLACGLIRLRERLS